MLSGGERKLSIRPSVRLTNGDERPVRVCFGDDAHVRKEHAAKVRRECHRVRSAGAERNQPQSSAFAKPERRITGPVPAITKSTEALPHLAGRLKKSIDEVGECVPVSELVIALRARIAAALHDDEFDELLLEVVVFIEAQSTREKEGHAWLPPCHGDEAIHVFLSFRLLVFHRRRQTDGYEG